MMKASELNRNFMDKIIEILHNIRPDVEFSETTRIIEDEYLDSLDVIRLVSELEKSFDISISGNEIVPENFNSVSSIQALINKSKPK